MNFEELQKTWQGEVNQPLSADEMQHLLAGIQQRYDKLERSVHWRDVREIMAAIFVVGCFAATWPIYRFSLVAVLGAAVIVIPALVIVYVLLSARKRESGGASGSLLDFSRQRLAWLDRQIRLSETVVWWYIAPIFAGVLIMSWGLTLGRASEFAQMLFFAQMQFFVIASAVWIIFLNKRAVRRELRPVRDEVARMVELLSSKEAE